MSKKKPKKQLRISKRKFKLKNEEIYLRDRKPGSYNQLWDWNTLEDVEIKRV